MSPIPQLAVVLGSLNRRALLQRTLASVRANGFSGALEIIVVDGGSADGTCDWLAKQRDVLTIVQPNYKVPGANGVLRRAHSWGEFINMGFRQARAPWILMVSDDLLLCPGAIANSLQQMQELQRQGRRLGGGALFWRDYPRDRNYHVKLLPGGFVHINHGFYWKEALEAIGYADETSYEFYGADGDLTMRLNLAGWQTVALVSSYAEHLNHPVRWGRLLALGKERPPIEDMEIFETKYRYLTPGPLGFARKWSDGRRTASVFWRTSPWACAQGILRRWTNR